MRRILEFFKSNRGATAIEYVLICTLLSVALVGGYKKVGQGYTKIYDKLNKDLP
ncbi:MAG: Flp family type IVb pilin [Alphaproteobacteria bacterium]|nr:Flp family type IVb pilin [Alphaproteobacteria bacterium]